MNAMRHRTLSGLYIILDPAVCPERPLVDVMLAAADAGASLFQYRNKSVSLKEAYVESLALRRAAARAGLIFLINDRCDLALAVDADGVHLGQGDLPYDVARKLLGPDKIIGVSTHNVAQVRAATIEAPDYLGFGPIFKPGSKRDHDPMVGVDGLRMMRGATSLPVFAIGGIHIEHVGEIMRAGANGVAVVSAVLMARDVAHIVRSFLALMPASIGNR